MNCVNKWWVANVRIRRNWPRMPIQLAQAMVVQTANKLLSMFIALAMRFRLGKMKSAHAVGTPFQITFPSRILFYFAGAANHTPNTHARAHKRKKALRTIHRASLMSMNLLYFGNFVIATITLLFYVLCVRLCADIHQQQSMRTEWFSLCELWKQCVSYGDAHTDGRHCVNCESLAATLNTLWNVFHNQQYHLGRWKNN